MRTANEPVAEELGFFLRHRADAGWACDLDPQGAPMNARLLGELDEVQRATLDRVIHLRSTNAPALAASNEASGIEHVASGPLDQRRGGVL